MDIQNFLDDNKSCEVAPAVQWDILKMVLRSKLILMTSYLNKKRNNTKLKTLDNIKQLEKEHKRKGVKKVLLEEQRF